MAAIEENIKDHKDIFDAHERLVMQAIDAENALRDAVADAGEGVSNGLYTVTFTPQTQTIFDEEKILAQVGMSKDVAVGMGLITVNQRPPRITIGKSRAGI